MWLLGVPKSQPALMHWRPCLPNPLVSHHMESKGTAKCISMRGIFNAFNCGLYRLRVVSCFRWQCHAHPWERLEAVVCKNVDTLQTQPLIRPASCVEGKVDRGLQRARTRWLVFRLSICFLNTKVHMSLHKNLIMSNVSENRGRSLENLSVIPHDKQIDIYDHDLQGAPILPARI